MNHCPSAEQLQHLLNEQLSEAERAALAEHVDGCAQCLAQLEQLTAAGSALRSPTPKSQGSGTRNQEQTTLDEGKGFLEQLKQKPPSSGRADLHRASGGVIDEAPLSPPGRGVTAAEWPKLTGYEILGVLGHGGMGIVYKARQTGLHRLVALKMIAVGVQATPRDLARFRLEAEAIARVQHPNIVQIYDIGEAEGRPYFALEFIEGGSLAARIRGNPQPVEVAARLIETLARAIHVAHQQGIVHRDLKPSNILLAVGRAPRAAATKGPTGSHSRTAPHWSRITVPKITDFGLAKRLEGSDAWTQTGEVLGTPSYMAPEQATLKGPAIGLAADVYALGSILYELLTGRPPFKAETALETVLQVLHEEPVPPGRLRPKLPRDLQTICLKCLEKEPSKRYSSAETLADDLGRFLKGEPIVARPVSAPERLWRWGRRNPVVAGLLAAVFLLLLLMAGVASLGYVSEAKLRAEAERQEKIARNEAANKSHLLYLANLNVIQQDWENGNFGRLRQLLEETRDHPDRSFEWAYWRRMSHLDFITLRGHTGAVHSVALSPDGTRVATGSQDGTVKLWDAGTGRESRTLSGHTGGVWSVAYSPDGTRLATGGADNTAKVCDATTGREILTLKGHTGEVHTVAFSFDGKHLVTGSGDRTAKVWDAATGREIHTLRGHAGSVLSAAFSSNGTRLVTGSEDCTAKLWDAATGGEVLNVMGRPGRIAHFDAVTSVVFFSDGQNLLTGGRDREVKHWNMTTGDVFNLYKGHTWEITSVACSPNGARLVTASRDRTAKVYDNWSGIHLLPLKGHTGAILSVAISADGRRMITGSADHTARVWDIAGRQPLTLQGHTGGIFSIAFSQDGNRVATGSGDRTAKVWDVASGRPLLTLPQHSREVFSLAFSPDGTRLVTSSHDRTAQVWDAATGRPVLTLEGHEAGVTGVAFSPDGRRLVTGSLDRTAKIWDATSGREILTLEGHRGGIRTVAFSPDSRRILTGGWDWTGRVWDATTGQEIHTLRGHTDGITVVATSPDGRHLATASWDRTVKLWDAATGQEALTLTGHKGWVSALAFSPDGRRLVTTSYAEQMAKLWDTATGREVLSLKHPGSSCVNYSPDGLHIVTGSADGTLKVWEAASDEQIAAWDEEERAAEESVAAALRERAERARADGFIQDWLILAPIHLAAGQTGADAVDQEQISGEARLQPHVGDEVVLNGKKLVWRKHRTDDHFLDFNTFLAVRTEYSVAYAVCYIVSGTERMGLQLKIGSDDQAKVYLNGREAYRCRKVRGLRRDEDTVANVTLKQGTNVLVFKVVNQEYDWKGCLRFVDQDGNPVHDLQVQLPP
jgi:WD40 repeat protein/serine/threonine protein kinase